MNYDFATLVDTRAVQLLMETLWRAIDLPAGLLDKDGRILVATGWQRICTQFHRPHPEAGMRCRESDRIIHQALETREAQEENEFVAYQCQNGLMDVALPVLIEGHHFATLYLGQFLLEPPDEERFRQQARKFGFDEDDYLEALRQVPILPWSKVKELLQFHVSFVRLMVQMGTEKLRRLEIQRDCTEREMRLSRQNAELLRLGERKVFDRQNARTIQTLRNILESTARALDVEKVGLWMFNRQQTRLRCLDCFDAGSVRHVREGEITSSAFPEYFKALQTESHLHVENARVDVRTSKLAGDRSKASGLVAMLDVIVWMDKRPIGVLRCQHGERRQWNLDERNFAGSMADFISLVLEGRDRRRAEAALRESEEKYRLIFEGKSDAILILDAENRRVVEGNKAASLLYGISREKFPRYTVEDLTADPEGCRERIAEFLSGKRTLITEARHRRRDGTVFPVEISAESFMWKGRRRMVVLVRDLTERQNIVRLKDDLLSTVSHEIRTPLTAILGFADYMRENEIDPQEQKAYLEIICAEGERLKALTDNLLDLQRLRAGFGFNDFKQVSLKAMITQTVQIYRAGLTRHAIRTEIPEDLPSIEGDERQIHRVLQNLLSNAIKYSPDGGLIQIGARCSSDFVRLWVQDQGLGIPEEAHRQIFDRFFRIPGKDREHIGGTGLGLALVKAVVEAHRGRVWVQRAPGGGSVFNISLPVKGQQGTEMFGGAENR